MAAALLDETAGPLMLAGCSMGGMVALEAGRQAPHRVLGLALLGSTARADTPELLALRRRPASCLPPAAWTRCCAPTCLSPSTH